MLAIVVRTELWFFFVLLAAALLLGAVLVFLIYRFGPKRARTVGSDGEGALYLIVSRLSHRLKTVGEVIRGHLHGFSDELPSDAERWRVARRAIGNEASEVGSLTQRLDLMVRLGMSGQPLVMEPVNLPALLEDIMIDLAPAAEAKGLVLGGVVRDEGAEVPYISADESALREVFSNILENAIKHNSAGTEVTAEVRAKGRTVEIDIADTGSGIPQETLSDMFDRGNRRYVPGENRGTGMGLYLCKLLTELHGGSISATSRDGEGTVFKLSLPSRRLR